MLSIPKTRSRANTVELLMPIAEARAENYGVARVIKTKAYADQRLRSTTRKPSPITQLALKLYEAACNTYLLAAENEFAHVNKMALCREIQAYEEAFNIRHHMEVERDQSLEDMKSELLSLRKSQLLARYGDYLAIVCNELKATSDAGQIINTAMTSTGRWASTAKLVEADITQLANPGDLEVGPWISKTGKPIQALPAIATAAKKAGLAFMPALYAVSNYGERNLLVHKDFKGMMEVGDLNELATTLHADLTDIPALFEARDVKNRAFLTAIVEKIIDKWFDRVKPFEANPAAWRPKPELYSEAQKAAESLKGEDKKKKAAERAIKAEEVDKRLIGQVVGYVQGQMPSGVSGTKRKVSAKVEHLDRKAAFGLIDSLGRKAKGHYDFKLAHEVKIAMINHVMEALKEQMAIKEREKGHFEKLAEEEHRKAISLQNQVERQAHNYFAAGFTSPPPDYRPNPDGSFPGPSAGPSGSSSRPRSAP